MDLFIGYTYHLFYLIKDRCKDLTEAEIQALIILIELEEPIETPNNNFYEFYPKSIEKAATYFRGLRLDWSGAFEELCSKGLVVKDESGFSLTGEGILRARQSRYDRPPIYYWYREFFPAAAHSRAYAEFCERLYGQAGFSDMQPIDDMIGLLGLSPDIRILDLGCGTGMLAEYISDTTGDRLWGMDYCPEAVEIANVRTETKRERLSYQVGNLDHLDYPENFFDFILSVDSLYMPNHLEETLQKMTRLLKPGGQMAVFYTQKIWGIVQDRDKLLPEKTPLGEALQRIGLSFKTRNYSRQTYQLMQQKRKIGEAMKPLVEAEGNRLLYEFIINESESSLAPYNPGSCNSSRYLYSIRLP
jgi:ubiquinone/menaquinone biosynthesis C-methylase UbiE